MAYRSNTVDIVRISATNEFYEIFSNTDILNKFITTIENNSNNILFSPENIYFEFYDKKQIQKIEDINYKFSIYNTNNRTDNSGVDFENDSWATFSFLELQQDFEDLFPNDSLEDYLTVSGTRLIFKIQEYYNFIKNNLGILSNEKNNKNIILYSCLNSETTLLKVQWYIKENNIDNLATEGAVSIRYGLSFEAAKFNVNATNINASIDNGFLRFDTDGLHLHNGGFKITVDDKNISNEPIEVFKVDEKLSGRYIPYVLSSNENPMELGLYEIVNGNYILTKDTSLVSGKNYYSQEKDFYLYFNGDGTFSGELTAATGSFSGELTAATGSFSGNLEAISGTIGGFNIENNQLISINGDYTLYNSFSIDDNPNILQLYEKIDDENFILTEDLIVDPTKQYYQFKPSITLNGISGRIIANDIILGNAQVANHIKLGNAYIYNPDEHNDIILEAGNTRIKQNGDLILGDLEYNSNTNTLKGINDSWYITPDKAVFNNIDIRGTIHASVFETGKIQTVGGGMIFSPSSNFEIDKTDNSIILTSGNLELNDNDLVLLTNNNSRENKQAIVIKNNNKIYFKEINNKLLDISDLSIYDTVTFLNNNGNEILIGVNATNAESYYLKPQGFSFIKPNVGNTGYYTEYNVPILFLGNLNTLGRSGVNGFGLYGENVFLKGSLTTESTTGTYAGINTINGATFNQSDKLNLEDTSNIIFWAGADSNSIIDIQNAKFQVTEKGTILAQQGYFADSVIINSQISASNFSTDMIKGSGNNPSLKLVDISNTKGGISLRTINTDEEDIEIFNLNDLNFKYLGKNFLSFSDNIIKFIGNEINIDNFRIYKNNNLYRISQFENENEINLISFSNDKLEITHKTNLDTTIIIEDKIIELSSSDVYIPNILSLGDKVNYTVVEGGYNIDIL